MIDGYAWRGGREAMLRFGPLDHAPLLVAAPLFEEANRTRAFVVSLCRKLAARGVATALPDLPGTGESTTDLVDTSLSDWRAAFAAAVAQPIGTIALRGGCLIDDAVAVPHWRFAPVTGAALIRDLRRARAINTSEALPVGEPVELAGNLLSPALVDALSTAEPQGPARTVRLETDPLPADRKLAGTALWRRAEPGVDPVLADVLADDIAAWIATCAS